MSGEFDTFKNKNRINRNRIALDLELSTSDGPILSI